MKLFMIELCAIIVIIVVSAFALKLYKRFYKYFSNSSVGNRNSKPEDSSAPATESEPEIKNEPPARPKRVAPDKIVLIKKPDPDEIASNDSASETVDIADDAEPEDSSAEKEHKTKIYSFKNGESSDSESFSESHDPSSPETESITKIFTGSDSEFSPPSN